MGHTTNRYRQEEPEKKSSRSDLRFIFLYSKSPSTADPQGDNKAAVTTLIIAMHLIYKHLSRHSRAQVSVIREEAVFEEVTFKLGGRGPRSEPCGTPEVTGEGGTGM